MWTAGPGFIVFLSYCNSANVLTSKMIQGLKQIAMFQKHWPLNCTISFFLSIPCVC